jgi:hypothetical protein
VSKDDDARVAELAGSLARELQFMATPGLRLVKAFLSFRDKGEPVSEQALAAVETAFRKILEGESADDALGVRRTRGKPADPSLVARNLYLAWKVADHRAKGHTIDQCIELVSNETGVHEDTIRKVTRKFTVSLSPGTNSGN